MADTVTLDPGSGGAVISTDDLGATGHVQWVKLRDGTDGGTQTIASGGGTEAASLRVTVASDSTGVLSVDDNGGSLTVDGTVTADTELPAAGALADATANPTTSVIGAMLECYNGTTWDRLRGDTTNGLDVDVTRVSGTVTIAGAVTNAGTFAVQESGSALTALQLIDDTVVADDAAFTVASTKVNMAGFLADQTSTDSVNEGDAGAARMTLDRKQIVTMAPSADTEGLSFVMDIDLDETETAIKATAGKLYGWYLYNDGAAEVYVKIYNATVASVVVGTTTPDLTIPVPAGSAANVEYTNGIAFSTAITAAATTGVATADATAPAANQVVANFFYA